MEPDSRDSFAGLAPLERPAIDRARAAFSVPAPLADVEHLAPGGFERYCKVLHPPSLPDSVGDMKPATWSALATAVGALLDASTCFSELAAIYSETIGPVEEPHFGSFTETVESGERIVYRLKVGELAASLNRDDSRLFVGVSSLVENRTVREVWPFAHLAFRQFYFAVLGSVLDLDASLEVFTGVIWPSDLSWWITSDVDLDFSIVGGSVSLIDRCLNDGRFEAILFE